VRLFFVLSGFLITTQLLAGEGRARTVDRFWLRSSTRGVPASLPGLLPGAASGALVGVAAFRSNPPAMGLWIYAHNIDVVISGAYTAVRFTSGSLAA